MNLVSARPVVFTLLYLACAFCSADTFTNKDSGDILHGYITGKTEGDKSVVYTSEKGYVTLRLSQWDRSYDRLGRKNKVIIIVVERQFSLQIVTDALNEALAEAAAQGPLLIILEINSPGGRADYIEKICDRIIRIDYCPTVGFIKSGRYGGALSGSSALALACDEIYMASDTTIGAAAIVTVTVSQDTEQLSDAWQDYLGRLAKRKGRPELIARAMVDKDIEVVEVEDEEGQRIFVRPAEVQDDWKIVRIWNRGGELLTLTAAEAVRCGIAQAVIEDRAKLLRELNVTDAEIVIDESVEEAAGTFRKVRLKFARLRNSLDGNIKRIEQTQNIEEAINLLRDIKEEYKSLLLLAKRYPDLYLDVELIAEQLETAQQYYQQAKVKRHNLTEDANEKSYKRY
jgi:ATP-dependent protease ClpP protease subunit